MMVDLISRAAALNALDNERKILIKQERFGAEHVVVHHARRLIEEAPAVDSVPVVHARWKFVAWHGGLKVVECSVCRKWAYGATAYCPHCAAKIDGEREE